MPQETIKITCPFNYFKDFRFYLDCSEHIGGEFEVLKEGSTVILMAEGYGKSGSYGNGALYLKLPEYERIKKHSEENCNNDEFKDEALQRIKFIKNSIAKKGKQIKDLEDENYNIGLILEEYNLKLKQNTSKINKLNEEISSMQKGLNRESN